MEQFVDIKGYEGLYQVSNTGRVKALARSIINKNGILQNYPEKQLKFDTYTMSFSEYQRVTLSKDHTTSRFLVHRLVAEHFIENTSNKPHVNHIDNNGTNNSITNLEWCTHSENMIHAQKQGRLHASQSKGGTIAGVLGTAKAIAQCTSMIGSTYGLWEVTSYARQKGVNMKHYVNCICTGCSRFFEVDASCLRNSKTMSCLKCSKRKNKI